MNQLPEIIAHRGAPREALENTLASFQIALEQGADGIELDVHATRDGVVVVHHDPVIQVTGATPHVSPLVIGELSAKELSEVPLREGTRVPTLDAVFELAGDRATIYVEVKGKGIEDAVAACLERHPHVRTAVHAFDHRIPTRIREQRPSLSIGLLSASYPLDLSGFVGAVHAQALWQQADLIDQALVDNAHALGMRVIAWTENNSVHARSLISMGVDALCTDTPGALRAALLNTA